MNMDGMLRFLVADVQPRTFLLLGCSNVLPVLRQRFPQSEFWVVELVDEAVDVAIAGVHWQVVDYLQVPLLYAPESFDFILAGDTLEQVENVPDMALAMYFWLKQDGYLLAEFHNVRFWRVMRDLLRGYFPAERRHFFSLSSLQRLFYSTFYREVFYEADREAVPVDFAEAMRHAGFRNADAELSVSQWIVKAARSTEAVAWLKRQFTPEVRRQLACLVRRIAYDIDCAASCEAFWQLYEGQRMTAEYALRFIESTALRPELVITALTTSGGGHPGVQHLLEKSMQD